MARPVDVILILEGRLKAITPVHVGGLQGVSGLDLPVARNGNGVPYIPGTSLAGAIRTWHAWARTQPRSPEDIPHGPQGEPEEVRLLWGHVGPQDDTGWASRVIVEDAVALPPEEGQGKPDTERARSARTEVRDGVGIDRYSGTAAPGIKFDREVLPRGTKFRFRISVEVENEQQQTARDFLADLAHWLKMEGLYVGAAGTRGLGLVKLDGKPTVQVVRVDKKEGVISFLRNNGQGEPEPFDPSKTSPGFPRLQITINWAPRGPVMVKAGYWGVAADILPLMSADGQWLRPVLPGSSIKGALRSHAERIMRTVCGKKLAKPAKDSEDPTGFLYEIEVPLVVNLFGRAARRKEKAAKSEKGSKASGKREAEQKQGKNGDAQQDEIGTESAGKGILYVQDCYAKVRVATRQAGGGTNGGRHTWEDVEEAPSDDALLSALAELDVKTDDGKKPRWDLVYHVAVDRWTGGAAEHMLYTVLEPHDVEWNPIRLAVDLARLPHDLWAPAAALLLLVLRDFAAGWIPLGLATNRGMGTVRVTKIKFDGIGLDGTALAPLAALKVDCSQHEGRSFWETSDGIRAVRQAIVDSWRDYVQKCHAAQWPEHVSDAR